MKRVTHLEGNKDNRKGGINATRLEKSALVFTVVGRYGYAVRMQAPPEALILFSADFEKNLALTIKGWSGSLPFPSTLK